MLRTRNNWLDSGIQNSIKIPKFEIFKKLKFMTHHMVLGNTCAKYEGNRSSGYEDMLRTRNNWLDSGIQNSIKIPKFEIFKKMKFMTHHMVLGNICAKYEGNQLRGYRPDCSLLSKRYMAYKYRVNMEIDNKRSKGKPLWAYILH